MRCGVTCGHKAWNLRCERGGGGSKPQQPQFIQPPPPQIIQGPAPNPAETSAQLAQSQLQYNPQLTAQAVQLQQQYGPQLAQTQTDIQRQLAPQLAQSQFDIQSQYGPMYRALYEGMFPSQTQGLERLAQQSLQQIQSPTGLTPAQQAAQDQARQAASGRVSSQFLDVLGPQAIQQYQSPQGLTPDQQAAQDAVRQRAFEQQARYLNTQANLGGTLYGGNNQLRNDRAYNELAQQFSLQDIQLQDQRRQQALQQLLAAQGMQGGIEAQRQQFGLQDVGLQQQQQQQALQNLIAAGQVVFPQVQQPGVGTFQAPNYGQSVTPSPDALLQAMQQSYIVNPAQFQAGTPGQPSWFGSFVNGYRGI